MNEHEIECGQESHRGKLDLNKFESIEQLQYFEIYYSKLIYNQFTEYN